MFKQIYVKRLSKPSCETFIHYYERIERLNKPDFFLVGRGCTTTCIVTKPPGMSLNVILESARVLLFSKIFPACMSFRSLTTFGVIVLPVHKNIPLKGKNI